MNFPFCVYNLSPFDILNDFPSHYIFYYITFNWITLYGLGLWTPCILKCTTSTTLSCLLYSEFGVLKLIHRHFELLRKDAAYQSVVGYLPAVLKLIWIFDCILPYFIRMSKNGEGCLLFWHTWFDGICAYLVFWIESL